ncbi:MAG: PP2C family protein-serine/threonine phosphatase [Phycisphaerales bacterium]
MPRSDIQLDASAQRRLDERLGAWQKRRARMFCFILGGLISLLAVGDLADLLTNRQLEPAGWLGLGLIGALIAASAVGAAVFRRMAPDSRRVGRLFGGLIMVGGTLMIVAMLAVPTYDRDFWGDSYTPELRVIAPGVAAMLFVFGLHVIGSLFVALPPRQALWPVLQLWAIFAAGMLVFAVGPVSLRILFAVIFPLAGAPGLLWSISRHRRWVDDFTLDFLHGRYDDVRRDLTDARRVHDALFPRPIEEGSLRLRYTYEPMRDLGGDFLFARRFGDGRLLAVVVDVTGHGVASALAVTRIHALLTTMVGPASRGAAGAPAAGSAPGAGVRGSPGPGELMSRLNAFVHEELAEHGAFATASALLVDATTGNARWSNAGHPPAFLRRRVRDASGERVETVELGSTCPMLGVLPAEEFEATGEPIERTIDLAVGDAIVLCTDGVIEAERRAGPQRNAQVAGRSGIRSASTSSAPSANEFGVAGFRAAVAAATDDLAESVMRAVRDHRAGPPSDDTLVVELRRAG